MRKLRVAVLLSCAWVLGHPAAAHAASAGESQQLSPRPMFRITATAWLASVEGHLQTPSGGRAGTTSPERPTLEEIGLGGLQALPTVDALIRIARGHELHFSYVHMDLRGEAVLEEDLLSQEVVFPAGSAVKSGLDLPFLRFGYRAHWLPLNPGRWHIAPEVGFAGFDFGYSLESPTVDDSVRRGYSAYFPYVGFLAERPLMNRLAFEGEVFGMAGVNGVSYAEFDVRLVYDFLRRHRAALSGVLGLRGLWLYRRDGQKPVPNEIDVRVGSFSTDLWAGAST